MIAIRLRFVVKVIFFCLLCQLMIVLCSVSAEMSQSDCRSDIAHFVVDLKRTHGPIYIPPSVLRVRGFFEVSFPALYLHIIMTSDDGEVGFFYDFFSGADPSEFLFYQNTVREEKSVGDSIITSVENFYNSFFF